MFHILLLVLKIIGIFLAVILSVAVLLACIVLFASVYYQIEVEKDEFYDVKVNVSFLYHLISGCVIYQERKLRWQLKILWKKINETAEDVEEVASKTKQTDQAEQIQLSSKDKPEETHTQKEIYTQKEKNSKKKIEKDSFFQKIKYTYRTICARIQLVLQKKEKLQEFVVDPVHQSAFACVKREVIRSLKIFKPKNIKGYVYFGFEDPYNTGKILAILGMLYPIYGEYINVIPVFEQKIFKGNVFVRGNLRGIYILIVIWKLFFDKNVKKTYRDIKDFN